MTMAALGAGYKEQFLTETGLTIKRETGGYYDRFTGRVIFPVYSISGRVIAFGGRVLKTSDRTAKYLNSPESLIYSKSHSLTASTMRRTPSCAKTSAFSWRAIRT